MSIKKIKKQKKKRLVKINHDYKCQTCGKPATVNLQNNWHLWDITPRGKFKDNDEWLAGENNFWCDECYEKNA